MQGRERCPEELSQGDLGLDKRWVDRPRGSGTEPRQVARARTAARWPAASRCGMLGLSGGHRRSEAGRGWKLEGAASGRGVEACVDSEIGEGAEVIQSTLPLMSRWRTLVEVEWTKCSERHSRREPASPPLPRRQPPSAAPGLASGSTSRGSGSPPG